MNDIDTAIDQHSYLCDNYRDCAKSSEMIDVH